MPNKILFYTSASDKLKAGGGMVVLNGRVCIAAVCGIGTKGMVKRRGWYE